MDYSMTMKVIALFLILIFVSCSHKKQIKHVKYKRSLYPHWIDEDKDCQNTRAEILIRDTRSDIKFKRVSGYYDKNVANLGRRGVFYKNNKPIQKPCNVTYGKWIDPYSNKVFTKASDLDIDHIIPLKHAHDHGAYKWSRAKKRTFANDPNNLLAVDKRLNRQKGSKSPNQWNPPYLKYRCSYLKNWQNIEKKYNLLPDKKTQQLYLKSCI